MKMPTNNFLSPRFIKDLNDIYFPIIDLVLKIFIGYLLVIYLRRRNKSENIRDRLVDKYLQFLNIDMDLRILLKKRLYLIVLDDIFLRIEQSNTRFPLSEGLGSFVEEDLIDNNSQLRSLETKFINILHEIQFLTKKKDFKVISGTLNKYYSFYFSYTTNIGVEFHKNDFYSNLHKNISEFCDRFDILNNVYLLSICLNDGQVSWQEYKFQIDNDVDMIIEHFYNDLNKDKDFKSLMQSLLNFKKILKID